LANNGFAYVIFNCFGLLASHAKLGAMGSIACRRCPCLEWPRPFLAQIIYVQKDASTDVERLVVPRNAIEENKANLAK
jgi:hypothetical protein